MTTSIKTCFKCGAEKPLTEFYKHNKMADGRLNKCKDCTKRDVRERRFNSESREKVLKYDRERGNRQDPSYLKEYRRQNPKKYAAHSQLNNAVRDGRVAKSDTCDTCGSDHRLHGHHDDYDKPLEARWLCAACHRQWHAENGEAKNASH